MDRDEMIAYLIDSDYHYIMDSSSGGGLELLDSYLGFGFKGYHNFSDDELRYEVAQRKEMENA